MNQPITNAEKLSKLPWSIGSNALVNVFVQLTFLGSVFILFLNTLGLDKSQIGFLLSLVPYTGLIALFIAPLIARYGYKRTFVHFSVLRLLFAALLLLTPWVVSNFGAEATLLFITVVVTLFSITRSIVVTAYYPWAQEYIPKSIQGKYSATNNLFTTLAGFLAVTLAGFVLDLTTGLTGYLVLIIIGVLCGAVAVWGVTKVPGGAPVEVGRGVMASFRDTIAALGDKGLLFFLAGVGLITLATVPLTSFVPLFLQEEVGLSSGNVVLVQTGVLLGGLVSTYLWGWTSDRYGSRPIMLSGICLLALLPIFFMLMPRYSPVSLYVALGIAFLQGIADMGWVIGSTRSLFVSIVPPEKRSEYTALYFACVGVFGGTSQLLAGQVVQLSSGVSGSFYFFVVDAYTPLFLLSIIFAIASLFTLRTVRSDTQVTVEEFAGMFLRGNPLSAMTSLVGYHFAQDESRVVAMTERLGVTRSPFTVDELLEVLADPRFNVRFEAIISIARTRPDPRLTQALIDVFNGTELALSNIAAWALGRVGDQTAIEALRQGLNSKYHSIQANSARALGRLGDAETAPLLLERLQNEPDIGLQMAYASALGNLRAKEATSPILHLLHDIQNEGARRELALALARLVGDEGHFIHLYREARADFGTATAQAVSAFKRKIEKVLNSETKVLSTLGACADNLARDQLTEGAGYLAQLIEVLPADHYDPHSVDILKTCAAQLKAGGATRTEYLLLTLHTLEIGWHTEEH
ncbi:MAG: MFS transporter [Anaerolineae bacterium]|nr:MFS transporter [Anaerolineae bacterium]